MRDMWWQQGWEVNYQSIHWMIDQCWIQGKYWHNPESELMLILCHGQMANSAWWQAIAGHLAQKYSVIAVDFSGMGDSQWREDYHIDHHIKEVGHLLDLFKSHKVITIGHSYGGFVGLGLQMLKKSNHLAHMLLDTPLQPLMSQPKGIPNAHKKSREINFYPTKEAIYSRFRMVPHQPIKDKIYTDHVIDSSIIHTGEGWRWKFDPSIMIALLASEKPRPEYRIPMGYIGGEYSPFWSEKEQSYAQHQGWQVMTLEGAYHALMLDAPYELHYQILRQIELLC
tara:strand:- start:4599 stop:5444 length:846 start_codon:yes stop_codon:yes gene_type:complete